MATNADGHLVDSAGKVAVDFVWGNMPPQPNDGRSTRLDLTLDSHINLESGWNGFPLYTPNTTGADVLGPVDYILVPNVVGDTVAVAQTVLADSGLGTITVASAYTPAVSSVALTTNVATLLTAAAHGYAVGDVVTLAGLTDVATDLYSNLNGAHTLATGTTASTLVFNFTHADLPVNTTTALGSGTTAKVAAKAGLVHTQSPAAGAATTAPGTAITITPYFAS